MFESIVRLFVWPVSDVVLYFTVSGCSCLVFESIVRLCVWPVSDVVLYFTVSGCSCLVFESIVGQCVSRCFALWCFTVCLTICCV